MQYANSLSKPSSTVCSQRGVQMAVACFNGFIDRVSAGPSDFSCVLLACSHSHASSIAQTNLNISLAELWTPSAARIGLRCRDPQVYSSASNLLNLPSLNLVYVEASSFTLFKSSFDTAVFLICKGSRIRRLTNSA